MTERISSRSQPRGRQWPGYWLLLILVLLVMSAGCGAPAARQAGASPTGAPIPTLLAPLATAVPASATAALPKRAATVKPATQQASAARPATAKPAPTPPTQLPSGLVLATPRPGDRMRTAGYASLPAEAHKTLALIATGGPFPYRQDGVVFQNREGLLPKQREGYYHEYTVVTPGSPDRGARRIIAGGPGEYYYTSDHYASFRRVVP